MPSILGLSVIEWEESSKIASFTKAIEFVDITLIMVAHCVHIGVLIWAAGSMWLLAVYNDDMWNFVALVKSYISLWIVLLLLGGLVLRCMGRLPGKNRFSWRLGISFLIMIYLPNRTKSMSNATRRFQKFTTGVSVLLWVYCFFGLLHCLMVVVCKQWPDVGTALLIDNPALSSGREVLVNGNPSDPAEILVQKGGRTA